MKVIVTSHDIRNEEGVLLIAEGTQIVLTAERTEQLRELGILRDVLAQAETISNRQKGTYHEFINEITKESTIRSFEELALTFKGLDYRILSRATDIVNAVVRANENYEWHRYVALLFSYVGWLYSHSINTATISCVIGAAMGYSNKRLMDLAIGALFHDIGLTLIPREMLDKPEKLSPVEYSLLQNHCVMGHSMMREINIPEISKQIILQHHEKLDGSGYPQKLKADSICEEAQIVLVAECFDTATTERSYKKAISARECIEEMYSQKEVYRRRIVGVLRTCTM